MTKGQQGRAGEQRRVPQEISRGGGSSRGGSHKGSAGEGGVCEGVSQGVSSGGCKAWGSRKGSAGKGGGLAGGSTRGQQGVPQEVSGGGGGGFQQGGCRAYCVVSGDAWVGFPCFFPSQNCSPPRHQAIPQVAAPTQQPYSNDELTTVNAVTHPASVLPFRRPQAHRYRKTVVPSYHLH